MNIRLLLPLFSILAAAVPVFAGCGKTEVFKSQNSLGIRFENELIHLTPVSDEIVHVEVTPLGEMPSAPDFMVVKDGFDYGDWSFAESEESITLKTPKLLVKVDCSSGIVQFFDHSGNVLLSELKDGRSFTPETISGEETFQVEQRFEAKNARVIYGLGGHQNRILNFKGKDALLEQYNVVDIVPFFWTDRNYGILWDNNSITRFGDPRPYVDLSAVELLSKDGKSGGLTTEYYVDGEFGELLLSQQEGEIAYEYLEDIEKYPEGFDPEAGSIRWEGFVKAPESGKYKFKLYGSHYAKVWIDGELIVDRWRQNWMPGTHIWDWDLTKDKEHKIRIDWICNEGYASLKCLSPEDAVIDDQIILNSEVGEKVNYYFVYGQNGEEIVQNYRFLTGQAPMMPKWAYGFWQSRERYKTQDELMDVVREFRSRGIGLDNIVLDWNYWVDDQWGSHEFDASRFPDPVEMIRELHEDLDTQIMISVWPKFYPETNHFQEMDKEGYLYRRNYDLGVIDWIGYKSTFYDAFNPGARKMFFEQIDEELFQKGIDALWLDATEPDIESNISIAERKLRMNPTFEGSGARVFNAFSINNAKGIYEEYREEYPEKRVFILTRSAYAGQHRYGAVTWSGDVATRWEDFKNQITYGLNLSAAGTPFWTTDIGGFSVEERYEDAVGDDLEEFRELNARWYQFGAFCPLFRVHGQYPFREIFNIAPEDHQAYKSMLKYNELRYQLMPYIYSLGAKVTFDGYTMTRPVFMDFPADYATADLVDQYMFGDAFLVCPVTDRGVVSRDVYLPELDAGWFDFHTHKHLDGGQTIEASAPYEDMPLYVKGGSIVLMGPVIEHVDAENDGSLDVWVFSGDDYSIKLYEDDGTSYEYESGAFSTVSFSWDESDQKLTVGAREGSFESKYPERKLNVHIVGGDKSTVTKTVVYVGEEVVVSHE